MGSRVSAAILDCWYLGQESGTAVALFGVLNLPGGKLTVTVPRNIGQVPRFYNSLPPERPGRYFNSPVEPLYVRDVVSSLSRPNRELKGFFRLTIEPGD